MTIRRGVTWGEPVESPPDLFVAPTDAAARAVVVAARASADAIPPIGFAGGDLARTMGGGAPDRFAGTVTRAPIDIVRVEADGDTTWGVAHVVARRRWWRGEVVLAMNAQFLGPYDVAPRSHPNDGRVDVLRVAPAMTLRTRLQARSRARTGSHLPHPLVATSQVPSAVLHFARPLDVWVDGVRWRRATGLRLTVEPDALIAHA